MVEVVAATRMSRLVADPLVSCIGGEDDGDGEDDGWKWDRVVVVVGVVGVMVERLVVDGRRLVHVMAKHSFPQWVSPTISEFYAEKCGISTLFDWQNEVLNEHNGENLVFSAPTSAGKSLVAELLAWRVAKNGRKVLFVLPYISVAREKLHVLQKCWRRDDIAVAGFIGPHASNPNEWMAAVCTIEKAASLINRALSEDWFTEIGMIVVDELHMIFDGSRGTHIDHMLSKILFWNQTQQSSQQQIQIIGMSATIPQIEKIGDWLNAKIYRAQFRPVELVENIIIGRKMRRIRDEVIEPEILRDFDDAIIDLTMESFRNETQTLIMCSSKIEVENVSCQIAQKFSELKKIHPEVIKNRLEGLFFTRNGLERNGCKDRNLIGVLGLTIAFHHAGLTLEERECVEQGFRDGHILILVATSTLASGVNLPAERVIIKSQTRGPSALNSMTYRQMIGRAGRMGHAKKGESFLIVRPSDEPNIHQAIFTPIDQIGSFNRTIDISRFVLEGIATGLTRSAEQVQQLTSKLLIQSTDDLVIDRLKQESFISSEDDDKVLEATQLGKATMASALPPEAALSIFEDLSVAKRAIVLDTELHMLYLVTPINITVWQECDWHHLFEIFTRIPEEHRRVAKLIGVNEKFLVDRMRGVTAGKDEKRLKTHVRFFSTLALFDLINEVDIHRVSVKYRIPRGSLQTLQSQSATYAGMIVAFCSRLGWTYLKSLLDGFAMRLFFGIRSELSDLVKIEGIDASRARVLHEKGIASLSNLAACDDSKLAHFLTLAVPYCRSDSNDGKGDWLFGEPRLPLIEAAKTLKTRARQHLMARIHELGLAVKFVEKVEEVTVDSGIGDSVKIEIDKIKEEEDEEVADSMIDQCTQSMTEMSIVSDKEEGKEEEDMIVESLETSLLKMEPSKDAIFHKRLSHVFQFSQPAEEDSFDLPVSGSIPIEESFLTSEKSFDVFATPPSAHSKVTLKHSRISYMVNSPSYIPSPIHKHPKIEKFYLESTPKGILENFNGVWLSLSIDEENFGIAASCENGNFYVSFSDDFEGLQESTKNSEYFGEILKSCADLEHRKKLKSLLEDEKVSKYVNRIEDCYRLVEDFEIVINNVKILNISLYFNNILEPGAEFSRNFQVYENWNFDIRGVYESSSGAFRNSLEAYAIFRIYGNLPRNQLEEQSTNLILKMYQEGIPIDQENLKSALKIIRKDIEELEEECWKLAHGKFNLESSQNVHNVLFKRLGLIYPEGIKSGTGKMVLEEVLEQHPIVAKIIKYRHLKYTIGQCLLPLEKALKESKISNRIRCQYDILTSTGRIITSSPNIQNIPKRESLNGLFIRSLIKCQPGFCLIAADYSQLELRVLAHLSGDEVLIEMIRSDRDIFEDLARKWGFERDAVKQLCYGLIYGMGTRSLAELTKLTPEEAENLYKNFFEMFPKVRSYINQTKEDAFNEGYVETILGRRRITEQNRFGEEKCREERVLVNFTIQGSASEIFKTAIVEMDEKFGALNARIILTIHDEVLVEVEMAHRSKVAQIIRVAMENSLAKILRVPMKVKIKGGFNWAEMNEVL